MFLLLLIRRFGLAAGSFFLVYALVTLNNPASEGGSRALAAVGAAIIAFFLPRIMPPAKRD